MVLGIYGLISMCITLVCLCLRLYKACETSISKLGITIFLSIFFSKLCLYKDYKLNSEHEMHLSCLNIRKFRDSMSKFRTGSHSLEIEVGRHSDRPRNERYCKLCNSRIKDETHLLIFSSTCKMYMNLR